ncbi:MAG: hypothetical protein H7333_07850 [Bdellovibrionales bacterium]|nr:hypothetical protein [Oligoflexia bacterium]
MRALFPTFVLQKPLKLDPKIHRELKRTTLKLPEVDEAGMSWSTKNYPNGYTSYGSLSELHRQFTVFDTLKKSLDREVKAFCKKAGITFQRGELRLSSLWVNIMPKNCYHAFHAHPNSIVSGTYYLNVPKKTSPLRLEDPRVGLFMACPPRPIRVDLLPRAGEVILFESWLKHEVPPHYTEEERLSVSFNYDWIQD